MIRFLAGFAFLLATLGPGLVAAQSTGAGDIFTVAGVPVEAEAPSAEEARLIAQDRGRAQALQILLRRLTPSGDWPYLPRPQLNELLDIQVGFEVENERFSTLAGAQNSYLADITYSFRPDRIRSLLRSDGIAFSESQAAPALVLPVFEIRTEGSETSRLLWEEENEWASAWRDMDLSHELVPMVLPLGDLSDATVVSVEDVVRGDWDAMQFLASRYNVEAVYVAHAILVSRPTGDASLYARMTEITANGVGQIVDTRVAGVLPVSVGDDVTGAATEPVSTPDEDALMQMAQSSITLLSGEIQERWKSRTLVSYDALHRLEATALFNSLQEWEIIRQALEASATVDSYDTHALSAQGAEVTVTFAGSPQQLSITLGQSGVALSGIRGYWDLRVRGATVRELPVAGAPGAGSGNFNASRSTPPVETVTVEQRREQNAPVLTDDDLEGLFDEVLTPEEIEERRARGLGDRRGTMQPVED